jgi:hypothetical protein
VRPWKLFAPTATRLVHDHAQPPDQPSETGLDSKTFGNGDVVGENAITR